MIDEILTLVMLVALQAVLGFDNLLYISLESKRAPEESQKMVRNWGIGIAMVLRIALLFILYSVIGYFQSELFGLEWADVITGSFTGHSLIVLGGGVFIIYTAIKEIWHMMSIENDDHDKDKKPVAVNKVITMIVIMNVVFSFDSILSAMALTDVLWVMTAAIIISGLLMIWLAGRVSEFLKRNRMYEVLGLFILLVVGIMLVTEGGHLAHLTLFGGHVEAMSKTTFYFVIAVLVLVDVVQGRYQRKILAEKDKVEKAYEESLK